jgi:hypothetical protein
MMCSTMKCVLYCKQVRLRTHPLGLLGTISRYGPRLTLATYKLKCVLDVDCSAHCSIVIIEKSIMHLHGSKLGLAMHCKIATC